MVAGGNGSNSPQVLLAKRNIQLWMVYRPLMEQRVKGIMALPWVKPYDIDLVRLYAKDMTFIDIVDSWVEAVGGPFTDNMELQPVLNKIRWTVENHAARHAERLLLTPASRAHLRLDRNSFKTIDDVEAFLLQQADEVESAQTAQP